MGAAGGFVGRFGALLPARIRVRRIVACRSMGIVASESGVRNSGSDNRIINIRAKKSRSAGCGAAKEAVPIFSIGYGKSRRRRKQGPKRSPRKGRSNRFDPCTIHRAGVHNRLCTPGWGTAPFQRKPTASDGMRTETVSPTRGEILR